MAGLKVEPERVTVLNRGTMYRREEPGVWQSWRICSV